ncbi:hypothetical protein H8784_02005 [Parabacteroides acidifaciens]|uniref:Transcriptional regulator n=1 Tax=Parabacteroides acidifaciens TaxID=2290935 RepID=A0ABR7NXZ9_9BACT|nr:hypothetical protein [Parabacteroides acidifaciens]MBC8600491.1 hypothetical protein [Parabacteroides acidifaciens]
MAKLNRKIKTKTTASTEEGAGYISKEEILAGIDVGLKDLKAGRKTPAREFLKELRDVR